MSFEQVVEVKEAHTNKDANDLLRNGWILLAVVPSGSPNVGAVVYVMGKYKPKTLSNGVLGTSTPRR